MFWNKKESENNNVNKQANTEQATQKKKVSSFEQAKELTQMIFKKRDYKIETREISKDDKKAALITAAIIIGVGLLLWFLPFTHQFFEDIIFLRR